MTTSTTQNIPSPPSLPVFPPSTTGCSSFPDCLRSDRDGHGRAWLSHLPHTLLCTAVQADSCCFFTGFLYGLCVDEPPLFTHLLSRRKNASCFLARVTLSTAAGVFHFSGVPLRFQRLCQPSLLKSLAGEKSPAQGCSGHIRSTGRGQVAAGLPLSGRLPQGTGVLTIVFTNRPYIPY